MRRFQRNHVLLVKNEYDKKTKISDIVVHFNGKLF